MNRGMTVGTDTRLRERYRRAYGERWRGEPEALQAAWDATWMDGGYDRWLRLDRTVALMREQSIGKSA